MASACSSAARTISKRPAPSASNSHEPNRRAAISARHILDLEIDPVTACLARITSVMPQWNLLSTLATSRYPDKNCHAKFDQKVGPGRQRPGCRAAAILSCETLPPYCQRLLLPRC